MPNKIEYPSDYDALIAIKDVPVAAINQESFLTYVNQAFEDAYGWLGAEIMGRPVTSIMPEHIRSMHMIGFSRFLSTEESRLIGKPVKVDVLCKNKEIKDVELFILSKKIGNRWQFAAIIKPESKNSSG